MTTSYDEIVDDFEKTESNLMRKYLEKATVLRVLKDVRGRAVLDLACGNGNYTRTIKEQGAAYVVGVDISEKMIARARLLEKEQPLGIEYLVRDVTELEQIGLFDAITAVYLFPYAQTEQALVDIAQAIYSNLKPNGRLVTLTINPDITEKHATALAKYNVRMKVKDAIQDGMPIELILLNPTQRNPIHIVNYYWSRETYERVLKKVGFQKIEWHAMLVAEEGIKEYDENYWQEYLANPHTVVVECHK